MTEQIIDQRSETERNLDEAANVRYLKNGEFDLFRTPGGTLRLTVKDDQSYLWVIARRCFPFAYPDKYISLRNGTGDEIGIITDLKELTKEHQQWISDDLDMRYFTPCITRIERMRQRYGGIEWHCHTNRGPKMVVTRGVHDTMQEVEPGRYIINDVDGNRYEVFIDKLDEHSRGIMERMI